MEPCYHAVEKGKVKAVGRELDDNRPIKLLNIDLKILAKILMEHLQSVPKILMEP